MESNVMVNVQGAAAAQQESPDIQQQISSVGVAEVIVVMKQSEGAAAALQPDVSDLLGRFTHSPLSQEAALARAGQAVPVGSGAAGLSSDAHHAAHVYPNLGVILGTVDAAGLKALREDARIATVGGAPQFSLIRPNFARPARLSADVTWGIAALHVQELWDQGLTGSGIRVAHLDTGVDADHPALKGAIVAFAEFDLLGQLRAGAPLADSGNHGTHTAATIAGRPVSGRYVGVAPGAELASAMVIEGGSIAARVIGGLEWAVVQGAKVLSMSLGIRGYWEGFRPIIQILRAKGMLPVIAVGNEGPGTSRSPGNYPESLSVGACDEEGCVAYFSSSQAFPNPLNRTVPDLVAPGVDVVSASRGGGYQALSGTSMATPHVAGLAALLMEAKPSASIVEVEQALLGSTARHCHQDPERGGGGVPDARMAFELLTGTAVAANRTVRVRLSSKRRVVLKMPPKASTPRKPSVRSRRPKELTTSRRKRSKKKGR